jgi:NAD(P)-dependent dehydrogenase (short-subunit alcohol dehydrogenase family)
MDLGLKGKVAVVTGSSKGIGYSIASALAREGCQVVISARRKEELQKAAAEIQSANGKVHSIVADATKSDDVKRLIDETAKKFGTIHILVNNAGGIGRFAAFEDLTDDEWIEILQLNVLSAVRACRAALPWMQKQKWGRIINISSESGTQPDALMPHYNASKAALNNLTKSLSKAYGKDGILVNTVSPAFIRTPLVQEMLEELARLHGLSVELAERNFLEENRPNIVLGRAGQSDETAGIVVFLASEQSSFITGANYRVDGGSVASI